METGLTRIKDQLEEVLSRNIKTLNKADEEAETPDNVMLGDWLLITSWVDPETGETYYHRLNSANLPEHARTGLLYTALEWE